ncbi:FecR family protein [Novosphingobium sp. PhB57]|uniref:FecR family protein n=1 Tax=unclassified Novosphingobium TaxID=2644732 RepID=UPI00104B31AA|nr:MULTISPECIES: FecR domain-containing protein [unclassified Novosphingobium]TCU61898.1 FecR family protein [Novosphingobium sp. PhB57]TDW68966.1 FecR family protein [Novosphingobium sp. PhB55]
MTAQRQEFDVIDREAAEWVDRMNRPLHDAEVAAEFDRWIMGDPRHVESYARHQALWQSGSLRSALEVAEAAPDDFGTFEDEAVPNWAGQAWKQFAGFAAVALCLVVVLSMGARTLVSESSYAAARGTSREVVLPDGSKVRMSGGTRMDVRITPWSREVALQNGEAFFDVAHEKVRTFSVNAGDSRVTVLGTAFDIDLVDSQTRVVRVYRGLVSVDAGAGRQWRLPAGNGIEVGGGRVRSLGDVRGDHPGWIDGWFDADDTSVQQLVQRINRGSDLPVVLADPGLGQLLVTGRFQTSDPEMVLEALAAIHDLQWRKEKARYVLSH